MPWNETDVMTEKERFVTLAQTGRFTVSELCSDFGDLKDELKAELEDDDS